MAVFFLFLRNVLLPIEILKIKILEHSDPPSQHFFVHKAFSHSFLCRRKVVLCHLAEWHSGSRHIGSTKLLLLKSYQPRKFDLQFDLHVKERAHGWVSVSPYLVTPRNRAGTLLLLNYSNTIGFVQ